ncbi:hypothetical protein HPB50_010949 [Hyalomma asiaticum]|uniref:Uncharacterized protein n=1 Tax=Hyalomma asiaticum TaxID=266040 RepID=A0ACB7SXV1_HYAAI|nr:hypothetical protein HPB50_010949 [Hyalomma asiaticum]
MPLVNWSEATPEDLAGFTADFLREELVRRDLDTAGSKEEVINRLIADIAQNRLTTSQLPPPDSAAPSQRPNTTSPPTFDAAQSTELLTVYSSAKLSTPSPQAPHHIEERMNVQAVSDKTRAPQRISALPVDQQEARYLTISARHGAPARTWPKPCASSAAKRDISHPSAHLELLPQRLQRILRQLYKAPFPRPLIDRWSSAPLSTPQLLG